MAFSELERARVSAEVAAYVARRRPPPELRPKLDISFRVEGQSVVIFEVRPAFQGKPGESRENAVAKATYVKSSHSWRVYWKRADLKWHRYEPHPAAATFAEFLQVVDADEYCCFWG